MPIDLIFYDRASQRFELNPKAVEAILDVPGSTGLVFNIGEPRIGKSFLLNRVMDLDRGFAENAKGLALWTKPFYREEENLYLFFVDAQGLDRDEKFANFVWTLSFLVGTIVMYSSVGDLNDRAYENLRPLEFVAKWLRVSADDIENSYMMSYYAPKLIWLMRDHRGTMDANGKPMQPDKLLENSLLEPTNNNHVTGIKKFISTMIKDRTAVSFAPFNNADGGFNYSTSVLKEKIYSRSFSKYFDGVPFNSRMLINFMVGFIELYNADKAIEYYDM